MGTHVCALFKNMDIFMNFKLLNLSLSFATTMLFSTSVMSHAEGLQCTDYIKQVNPNYIGFNGHATDWFAAAPDWGFNQILRPTPGSVIVVGGVGNGAYQYGHVMYVTEVLQYNNSKSYTVKVTHANKKDEHKVYNDTYTIYKNSNGEAVYRNDFDKVLPINGIIFPKEIGFGQVSGASAVHRTNRGKGHIFQLKIRNIGENPIYSSQLKLIPLNGNSSSDFKVLGSVYRQSNSSNGDLNTFNQGGKDIEFNFLVKALKGFNGQRMKPKWCIVDKNNAALKYGCFQFPNVYMGN